MTANDMKKCLFRFFIFIYLTCSASIFSLAQSVCAVSLSTAQDSFDSGNLYGILAVLQPCLDDGFSKAEKIQAYWLLTKTYLIVDDPISAENSYLKLLNIDPEYKVDNENDPIETIYLSKKFKTTPIFTFNIVKAGFNTTSVEVINAYVTGNSNKTLPSYFGEVGFQVSSALEWNVNEQWSLNVEAMFIKRSFSLSNILFVEDKQTLKENQFWIELPVYVKYSRSFDKFHPYVYGGYDLQYLLSAHTQPKLINKEPLEGGGLAEFPVSGLDVSITEARKRFTSSVIVGLGVKYPIGNYNPLYLTFDVRYTIGLKNLLDEQSQYIKSGDNYDNELQFVYGYVDSDFRINSLSASFGIVKPLYKPRKIDTRPRFTQRLFGKQTHSRK